MNKFEYQCHNTKQKININFHKIGNAKKVAIIMHGWGQTSQTMRSIAHSISPGYTVYNLDLPGFGLSTTPENWTVEDYSTAIEQFIAELELDSVTLIGHSFGGRIGIFLAAKSPVVNHLVLIDSAGIKKSQKLQTKFKILTYKTMRKFISLPLINKNKEEYEYNLKQIFGSKDYNYASPELKKIMINAVNYDLTPLLTKINCKTSLFWGINDQDTPFADAKKMNRLIHDSTLYSFDAGHYPFLDVPSEFFAKFNQALKVGGK